MDNSEFEIRNAWLNIRSFEGIFWVRREIEPQLDASGDKRIFLPTNSSAMRRHVLLFSLCLGFALPTRAGIDPFPGAGARLVALGYAYSGLRGDLWSVFANPAGITGLERPAAGLYFEQRFFLSELTYGSAGAVYPFWEQHAVGLDIRSFGFEGFRQTQIGLAYGVTVLDRISLGIKAKYATLNIRDYGAAGVFLLDAGLHVQLNEQIGVGASGRNLNRARITTTLGGVEQTPTVLQTGVSYRPTETVLLLVEVVKEEAFDPSFRGGIEYEIAPILKARVGGGVQPLLLSGGLGLDWDRLALDVALSYTEQFASPHLSLSYGF